MKVYAPTDGFSIGGGGRYDNLVGRFGRDLPACGFALNLERLHLAVLAERRRSRWPSERVIASRSPRHADGEERSTCSNRHGYDVAEVRENDRKLFFAEQGLITMRPSDVPTYVERGVADIGIVGKDVLMEQSDRDVHELVDLDFGACSMVVAVAEGRRARHRRTGSAVAARCASRPSIRSSTERYFGRPAARSS